MCNACTIYVLVCLDVSTGALRCIYTCVSIYVEAKDIFLDLYIYFFKTESMTGNKAH